MPAPVRLISHIGRRAEASDRQRYSFGTDTIRRGHSTQSIAIAVAVRRMMDKFAQRLRR